MSKISVRAAVVTWAVGAAVVTVALAGLAAAMPAGPGAPQTQAGLLPSVGGAGGLVSVGDTPVRVDAVLPAPEPIALRADEIQAWVAERTADAPDQEEDPWAIIDQCVADDMLGDPDNPLDDTPAASIAIAVDGVITYTKGYGQRDVDAGGEVDADTMFRIGSTTKMMTAAAVMQLREQGAVDMDAPLPTYLPEYRLGHPWDSADLTLDVLLSHQTGLLDQYFVSDLNMSLMDWVQATGAYSLPLYAPPGSFWNYANPNFSLAGAVVERVSGVPYAQFMAESVWDPSGMPLTTVDPTEVISTGNYTTGYHNGEALAPGDFDIPFLAPAGTAYSTPTELVTWALALQSEGDDVLSAESKDLMQTRHVGMGYLPWMDYGYGIMITDWRDAVDPDTTVTVYDHGGNINGGSSQLFWIPERGVVVSVLANTIRSLDGAAACAVQTLAGIEPIPGDSTRTEPEEWDVFTGTYSMLDVVRWPWTASVTRITDTLMLDFPDIYGSAMLMGNDMPFYYAYADLFVPMAPSMLVPQGVDTTFIRDPDDPSRVRYMRNRNLVGQRVGQFPDRVAIEGEACATLNVTSELDMPMLSIDTSGLATVTRLVSLPLTADAPGDITSASIKHDIEVGEGGADMVYVVADTEPEDAASLFLLGDFNGDGAFVPGDGEIVAQGINDYGTSLLYVPTDLPPGAYQLWAHGTVVQGEESVLHLDITVMQGDHLRLENRPRGLIDGATWEMQVCADDVDDLQEPALGMLEFTYDSPPRLFRVMVDWEPSTGPTEPPAIFLPYAKSRD